MTVTLASPEGTWVGTSGNPVTLSNAELRRADAALVGTAGVGSGLAVSVDGADLVTVTAGSVVISGEDAVVGTGVYRAGIGSSATGTLEARHATLARIDLVVFRQYDPSVVGAHTTYTASVEIIKGTPSGTPAVPTRPSMATELARISVPATGGGTASVDSTNRVLARAVGAPVVGAWQSLTLASGWTGTARVKVDGDTVKMSGSVANAAAGAGAWVTCCTLPVGYRPAATELFGIGGNTSTVLHGQVTTAGLVQMWSLASTSAARGLAPVRFELG